MANHEAIQLALRTHLRSLTVCQTGVIDLAATATGYTRPNGSFLLDGFAIGMEVTPVGFSQTAVGTITDLTALTMTISGGRTIDAEAPSRQLRVLLPELVQWDNVALRGGPITGRPYLEEEYAPATASLVGMPYTNGTVEDTGLYIVRWYAGSDLGLGALATPADAILSLFKPGTALSLGGGLHVRVRGDTGPSRSPIRVDLPGWSVITVTIPWRVYSLN